VDQSITEEFPILEGDDFIQAACCYRHRHGLRRSLQHQNAEQGLEVATVLKMHANSVIIAQLFKLHAVVAKFGGVTAFSDAGALSSTDAPGRARKWSGCGLERRHVEADRNAEGREQARVIADPEIRHASGRREAGLR
jgi:hypothetical protein